MTEPDFRKTYISGRKCQKNRFIGIFSRFLHLFFLIFCSKMRIRNAQNMAESDFVEKFFFGWKCRKYAGNPRFCRFSSDFFLIFYSFFHTKTLFITMPTIIKHGSIVNKTDFCSRKCLKIAGTADFRWQNSLLNFSSCTLYFFMKFCTLMQNANT